MVLVYCEILNRFQKSSETCTSEWLTPGFNSQTPQYKSSSVLCSHPSETRSSLVSIYTLNYIGYVLYHFICHLHSLWVNHPLTWNGILQKEWKLGHEFTIRSVSVLMKFTISPILHTTTKYHINKQHNIFLSCDVLGYDTVVS
jgi:hypothetical protein